MIKLHKASVIAAIVFLTMFLLGICYFGFITVADAETIPHKQYAITTVVSDVSESTITTVDFNGNVFMFADDNEDWVVGDYCSMIMDNNGTEVIYDDIIISARYSGFLDGHFGYDKNGNEIISSVRTREIVYVPVTQTVVDYIEVSSETIYIDATEEQLEDAFTDGYNQGNCDGYADGYWQAYRDCMSDYALEPQA